MFHRAFWSAETVPFFSFKNQEKDLHQGPQDRKRRKWKIMIKKCWTLAMDAGRILLDAGAEIFRVEETIQRIADSFWHREMQYLCAEHRYFYHSGKSGRTDIRQCKAHTHKRGKASPDRGCKSAFQRDRGEKVYGEGGRRQTGRDKHMPGKRGIVQMFASGVGSGCFCYLLGGNLEDMAAAFLSGFLLYALILGFGKAKSGPPKSSPTWPGAFAYLFLRSCFTVWDWDKPLAVFW